MDEKPPVLTVKRAFQWDLARQVERLDWLLSRLPLYADWGYQELYLHLEDAVEFPGIPGIARKDAYSYRDMARLVWAAGRVGIRVVPIVNLLGHTQYLIKVPALRKLNELAGPDGRPLPEGQVCPAHPETLEVAERLMRDVAPFCTAGRVHAGLDESYWIGRHPRSRAEIAALGMAGHFAGYVGRLAEIAGGLGVSLGMWGDMLPLLPEALPLLPSGVAVYDWYYYPFRRRPAVELWNYREYDLAEKLRARGIEYWGCPMNGAFRHEPIPIFGDRLENIVSWWRRCRATGAAGMLVTSWEPACLAAETPMLVDAAAAGLWLDGDEDPARLLAAGARRLYGRAGGRLGRLLAVSDRHPHAGYVRWRIKDRWDTVLSDESLAPWRREARELRRLASAPRLPAALRASFRYRSFLADRDLFVRAAGQGVWRARSAARRGRAGAGRILADLDRQAAAFGRRIPAGRAAAREMWRLSRDRTLRGPNEREIAADARRLRSWRAWLKRAGGRSARPGALMRASPVAGAWQLVFSVLNFAPAAQKIVVERRVPGGPWEDVHGCFTIAFQSGAARPGAKLRFRFSAPVDAPGPSGEFPRLRVAVRGFGRVRVENPVLTDGVTRIVPGSKSGRVLGRDARRGTYPDFDWAKDRGTWELRPRSPRFHAQALGIRGDSA